MILSAGWLAREHNRAQFAVTDGSAPAQPFTRVTLSVRAQRAMMNSQQLRYDVDCDQHRRCNDHVFKYDVVEPVFRERRVRLCHPLHPSTWETHGQVPHGTSDMNSP